MAEPRPIQESFNAKINTHSLLQMKILNRNITKQLPPNYDTNEFVI